MEFILAQIFGGVALILVCISYFFKRKTKFLVFQIFADAFYAAAFFVVGANVAACVTTLSIIRNIVLYFQEKSSYKHVYFILSIFIALYITIAVIFWKSPLDIMPLTTSILFATCYTIKDLQKMRYFLLIPNTIVLIYNILSTTYTSAILDFIEVIVIIIAIVNYNKKIKKETT